MLLRLEWLCPPAFLHTHPCLQCCVGLKSNLVFPVSLPTSTLHSLSHPFCQGLVHLLGSLSPGWNSCAPLRRTRKLPLFLRPSSLTPWGCCRRPTQSQPLCPTALRSKTRSWNILEFGGSVQRVLTLPTEHLPNMLLTAFNH